MARVARSDKESGELHGWLISCPACGYPHLFDGRWTFNGDMDKPTFAPSMLVNGTLPPQSPPLIRCHSFVRGGMIEFLSDCTHEMAGKTVELPEFQW